MSELASLRAVVQRNCDISDAQYARNYTMCVYLLKMREFFRWEHGLALTERLPGGDVGAWVDSREQRWEAMLDTEFDCMPMASGCADPFASEDVNAVISKHGLVYSGGIGRFGKPHFFLADLHSRESRESLQVYVSGREYARDLTAPPAMMQGRTLFVRRESLRRSVFEMVDEWRWKRRPGPMAELVAAFDYDHDPEQALEAMTDCQVEALVRHELGEARAGKVLGPDWERMLSSVLGSRMELTLRAARDHLADCLVTLPWLAEQPDTAPVHFWFANVVGMRKALFPRALIAYKTWRDDPRPALIAELADNSLGHWQSICECFLDTWRITEPGALERALTQVVTDGAEL